MVSPVAPGLHMSLTPPRPFLLPALLATSLAAASLQAAPAWLETRAGFGPGRVALAWASVAGANSYNVKRSTTAGGPYSLLGNTTGTTYSDPTALEGSRYWYAVVEVTASGEATSHREIAASPGIIADNSDTALITTTGNWATSTLAGFYGVDSEYAGSVAGTTATATFKFAPSLPFFANYDLYMRWPAHANRSTATPVDIRFTDGGFTTLTVDQTQGGNTWVFLATVPGVPGTQTTITLRNNTGVAGENIGADAVQFVPRLTPWGPRGIKLEDYTVPLFSDECSGDSLNPDVWEIALSRPNVSVGNGKISLDIDYTGPGTAATATLAELKDPFNWNKGAVQPVHDSKYGYYETRYRIVQQGGGVDCAFWMSASGSMLPWEGFEFDSPEIFPDATLTETDLIYGMWDHRGGSPPWRMNKITYDRTWALKYHTYGMDWRTDNILVHYLDGVEIGRSTAGAVNSIGSMAPINTHLSCYVGNYWQPAASIDGQSAKVDYLRCYQKPGWTGALGPAANSWGDTRNWGPDGIPGSGEAAVFNLPVSQPRITLWADKDVHSLCFDGTDVAPMVIDGNFALRLGAGGNSIEQGGVCVTSSVASNQTIRVDLVALQPLSFYNNSTRGASLFLNGRIDGEAAGPARKIHFAANAPIAVAQPFGPLIGEIIKWGGAEFAYPSASENTGRLRVVQGAVTFDHLTNGGLPSGLGKTSSNPVNVAFEPKFKHSVESLRPRLRYTGPAATTNRGIALNYFCDGILDASGTGPMVWTGALVFDAGNTGTAILEFSGTNTGDNRFGGVISDAAALNPSGDPVNLEVRKTGPGTWIFSAANAWHGVTRVNEGSLRVNGSLTSAAALTVLAPARLGGTGTISAPSTIIGTLAPGASPGTLTFTSSLAFANSARLEWELPANADEGADRVAAAAVNITAGARIDLVFNTPGSTVDFLDRFWREPRSWPVLTSSSLSGAFQLGDISVDSLGRAVGGLGVFTLHHAPTGVTLVWTPIPDPAWFGDWQDLTWPGVTNETTVGLLADPDLDGLSNLLEWALHLQPGVADRIDHTLTPAGTRIEYVYTRRRVLTGEAEFAVEWSDSVSNGWSNADVEVDPPVPVPGDDARETVRATIPAPAGDHRYLRLMITRP